MWKLTPVLVSFILLPLSQAAERIDNVLLKLIPPDTQSLFGARMEQLKLTPLYRNLLASQNLAQLDVFAKETGFDPRRDVRDLLIASSGKPKSGVLLARGTFHVSDEAVMKAQAAQKIQYKGYALWVVASQDAGFCILDSTLAIAGPLPAMKQALDQYKTPASKALVPLLAKAFTVPPEDQVWVVSLGSADFLANNLPLTGNAANFGQIFRSLEETRFQADLSRGFNGVVQGSCRTDADAKSLGDAARGLIGFGRLNVPDDKTELLKIWDAIQVQQEGKRITLTANIPQELIDQMVKLFTGGPKPPARPRMPSPPKA